MTKSLIKKEFILTAHPTTFMFVFFGAMLLIPSYPYTIAFFYVCLGLFFSFMNGRENKDNIFMAILPVAKKDAVKAKVLFSVIIEITSMLIAVPFACLSVKINPNGNNLAGLDANVAFFGVIFVMFALFNYVFFTNYYKTAYKVGIAFLLGVIPVTLTVIVAEALSHIPGICGYFDSTDPQIMVKQLPILACGFIAYIVITGLAYKKSVANFENVDL